MPDMREINPSVIAEYRATGGKLSGPIAGLPVLLLTTSGCRTGDSHTTPLGFTTDGHRLIVAAVVGRPLLHDIGPARRRGLLPARVAPRVIEVARRPRAAALHGDLLRESARAAVGVGLRVGDRHAADAPPPAARQQVPDPVVAVRGVLHEGRCRAR